MATTVKAVVFQLRDGLASEWTASNRVLRVGEPGVEVDTHKFKIGDGETPWNDLHYYINEDEIARKIRTAISTGAPIVLSPENLEQIADQVTQELELPDLVLLWQNAKA